MKFLFCVHFESTSVNEILFKLFGNLFSAAAVHTHTRTEPSLDVRREGAFIMLNSWRATHPPDRMDQGIASHARRIPNGMFRVNCENHHQFHVWTAPKLTISTDICEWEHHNIRYRLSSDTRRQHQSHCLLGARRGEEQCTNFVDKRYENIGH